MSEGGMIKLGPAPPTWGLMDTEIWDGGLTQIVQIFISHGTKDVSGLQFQYLKKDQVKGKDKEELVLGDRHGEFTRNNFDIVTLKYPMEQLTGIKVWGYYKYGSGTITSVSFQTNLRTHGPFGRPLDARSSRINSDDEDIESYCYNLGESGTNQFGGFHGAVSEGMVSHIGIYVKPFTSSGLD